MIRTFSGKLRPVLAQALYPGDAGAGGLPRSLPAHPGLATRPRRPLTTVIHATVYQEVDGRARFRNPGHVQFQASASDLRNNPRLAPALGHGPADDPTHLERVRARGELPDGLPFYVRAVRNRAIRAGDDTPTDVKTASHVIDHGDMTPEQSQRYEQAQGRPVFPVYEAFGPQKANCVYGYVALAREILGVDAGASLPRHALPQHLAPVMAGVRTTPDAADE